MKPIVTAIREFYTQVLKVDSLVDCSVKVCNVNEVRVELFKLFYESGEFVLNSKADAYEALD